MRPSASLVSRGGSRKQRGGGGEEEQPPRVVSLSPSLRLEEPALADLEEEEEVGGPPAKRQRQARAGGGERKKRRPSLPFDGQCPLCDKKFNARPYLRRHVLVIHMGEPLGGCSHCEEKFTHNVYFGPHVRERHPPGEGEEARFVFHYTGEAYAERIDEFIAGARENPNRAVEDEKLQIASANTSKAGIYPRLCALCNARISCFNSWEPHIIKDHLKMDPHLSCSECAHTTYWMRVIKKHVAQQHPQAEILDESEEFHDEIQEMKELCMLPKAPGEQPAPLNPGNPLGAPEKKQRRSRARKKQRDSEPAPQPQSLPPELLLADDGAPVKVEAVEQVVEELMQSREEHQHFLRQGRGDEDGYLHPQNSRNLEPHLMIPQEPAGTLVWN